MKPNNDLRKVYLPFIGMLLAAYLVLFILGRVATWRDSKPERVAERKQWKRLMEVR